MTDFKKINMHEDYKKERKKGRKKGRKEKGRKENT